MKKVVEGSAAIAEAIKLVRAQVIAAYPITPQTHIVQNLSEMVANGDLKAEYVRVESEHSAASAVLGASAVGARAYTASSSQGIMLMAEVLFNIAGMRFPVVMTAANRALSGPINIWNDQQDSYSVRDAGWIQLHAEDNQEAMDLHIQAYRIAEDLRVQLPVMVCMDGFVLTHSYEPVDFPGQEAVDRFLPPYDPTRKLNPQDPKTFGMYAEEGYTETRFAIQQAMQTAKGVIEEVSAEFERAFGRSSGGLIAGIQTGRRRDGADGHRLGPRSSQVGRGRASRPWREGGSAQAGLLPALPHGGAESCAVGRQGESRSSRKLSLSAALAYWRRI